MKVRIVATGLVAGSVALQAGAVKFQKLQRFLEPQDPLARAVRELGLMQAVDEADDFTTAASDDGVADYHRKAVAGGTNGTIPQAAIGAAAEFAKAMAAAEDRSAAAADADDKPSTLTVAGDADAMRGAPAKGSTGDSSNASVDPPATASDADDKRSKITLAGGANPMCGRPATGSAGDEAGAEEDPPATALDADDKPSTITVASGAAATSGGAAAGSTGDGADAAEASASDADDEPSTITLAGDADGTIVDKEEEEDPAASASDADDSTASTVSLAGNATATAAGAATAASSEMDVAAGDVQSIRDGLAEFLTPEIGAMPDYGAYVERCVGDIKRAMNLYDDSVSRVKISAMLSAACNEQKDKEGVEKLYGSCTGLATSLSAARAEELKHGGKKRGYSTFCQSRFQLLWPSPVETDAKEEKKGKKELGKRDVQATAAAADDDASAEEAEDAGRQDVQATAAVGDDDVSAAEGGDKREAEGDESEMVGREDESLEAAEDTYDDESDGFHFDPAAAADSRAGFSHAPSRAWVQSGAARADDAAADDDDGAADTADAPADSAAADGELAENSRGSEPRAEEQRGPSLASRGSESPLGDAAAAGDATADDDAAVDDFEAAADDAAALREMAEYPESSEPTVKDDATDAAAKK